MSPSMSLLPELLELPSDPVDIVESLPLMLGLVTCLKYICYTDQYQYKKTYHNKMCIVHTFILQNILGAVVVVIV
jgi:hypothetical protein